MGQARGRRDHRQGVAGPAFLLELPLAFVGVPIGIEKGCQQTHGVGRVGR